MRWPWQAAPSHDVQPLVREVTGMARSVKESAGKLRLVAAELDAAAELIHRNDRQLRQAGDRRRYRDRDYPGPERRGHR